MGIRLVAGLIVLGGLGAGSIGSTLAAPGNLDGLTVTARFEKCTEGSPDNCKQIKPEEPSKRGGKPEPEKERPPRGGKIQEPPDPQPPTGGRIRKDDTPKRDEPQVSRTIRSSGGNSEAFTATHLAIPVVNSSDAPVAQPAVAAAPVAQPVARPVVAAAPSAGIGPESTAELGLPALLAALATMFGAGAFYVGRRPEVSRVRN
jgi:hypothetical protein